MQERKLEVTKVVKMGKNTWHIIFCLAHRQINKCLWCSFHKFLTTIVHKKSFGKDRNLAVMPSGNLLVLILARIPRVTRT